MIESLKTQKGAMRDVAGRVKKISSVCPSLPDAQLQCGLVFQCVRLQPSVGARPGPRAFWFGLTSK